MHASKVRPKPQATASKLEHARVLKTAAESGLGGRMAAPLRLTGKASPTQVALTLQRIVGNRSVARLARSGRLDSLDLKLASGGSDIDASSAIAAGAPAPAGGAARAAPADGVANTPSSTVASARNDATPNAAPSSTPRSTSGQSVGGALGFLTAIQSARPSSFPAAINAASGAATAELDALGKSNALDPTPAPTGLASGDPVKPPETPQIPQASVLGPASTAPATPSTSLEATGDIAGGQADEWSRDGIAALDQTSLPPPPAPISHRLRSPVAGELPAIQPPAATAPPNAGAFPLADADALSALDLNMARSLPGDISHVIAPAVAADRAHTTSVAAVKNDAKTGLVRIDSDTRRDQIAAGTSADREIQDLHAGSVSQRAAIVNEHKSWIKEQSDRSRGEAQQTIAEANSRAKTQVEQGEKSQSDGQPQGWWDKIKAAGRAAVDVVKGVASSVLTIVAGIFDGARAKIRTIISQLGIAIKQRIDAVVKAISSATRRVWSAVAVVVEKAQAFVRKLADAAADLAKKLWAGLKARLAAAWDLLARAVKAAFDSFKGLVKKISSALSTLREILKILKSGVLEKLFEFVNDPALLAKPIVDKARPLVGQVPPKADELAADKSHELPLPASAQSATTNTVVQRKPAPQQSVGDKAADLILEGHIKQSDPEIAPAPVGEGFWSGVWRHLKAAGNHFLQNWEMTLINLVWSLLTFYPVLLQEGPKLWNECKAVIFGGGGVDRFDHVLGVLRGLVNIVAGLVATAGIWALIIGAFTGPGEAIVVGAYETISFGIIAADVALGFAEMGKAWYSATREGISTDTRETYLEMFSSSAISTAITIILVILGVIASRFAKAFKARRAAAEAGEATKPKPKSVEDPAEPKGREEGKGADGKGGNEVPSQDGNRRLRINEEGRCEVCASPCDDIRETYQSVMTPEAEAKIKAVEDDTSLSDLQKEEQLKPIEQELSDLLKAKADSVKGPYSNISDGTKVGPGRDYTPQQKAKILAENAENNKGVLRSDDPADPWFGKDLVAPPKGPFEPGNFPQVPPNQAQVDHIVPKTGPDGKPLGSNSYSNARVVSAQYNNMKRNKL